MQEGLKNAGAGSVDDAVVVVGIREAWRGPFVQPAWCRGSVALVTKQVAPRPER